jgi:multiple sugar transport system substrate-binding protein
MSDRRLTRRKVLQGALGVGVLAAISGGLASCSQATPPAPPTAPAPPAPPTAPAAPAAAAPPPTPVERIVERVVTATPVAEQVVLTHWDSNPDQIRETFWKDFFERFERENPNVKGQYVPTSANTYLQRLTTAIGGGKPPDTADMQGGWLAQFASMGALLDLTPYFQAWKNKDDYLATAVKLANAFDDKMYWIPNGNFSLAILYRPDWVAEAGLKPPLDLYKEGKWTWDTFLETAKALTRPDQNRFGFSLRGGFGGERNLFNILMSYTRGVFFDQDNNSVLDKDEAVAGLTWYADLFRAHKVSPASAPNDGWREMTSNYTAGTAAIYMHSADGLTAQRSALGWDKVAVVPVPAGPAGSWQQLDGLGFAALAQSKHPELAAKMLFSRVDPGNFDRVTQEEAKAGQKPFSSGTERGMVFKSLFTRKEYKEDPDMWAFDDVILNSDRVYIAPMHLPEYTSLVNGLVLPQFQKVLLGQMQPKEAASNWAAEFTKAQKAFVARQKSG